MGIKLKTRSVDAFPYITAMVGAGMVASAGAFSISTAGPPTPLFAQGVGSDLNDNNGIDGNNFTINLPNTTIANNTIILSIAYPYSASRTCVITDSAGDTWPSLASAITTGTASTGNMRWSTFVLQNASAGLHNLLVTFDARIKPFQYTMAEFVNVGAVDGSHGAASVTHTTADAGSYTPTTNNDANGGHLIWTVAISNDTVGTLFANQASAIAKRGGISPKFMHANNICTIPNASSFDVQTTNAAVNPGFNFTQSTGTNFVVQSIALKVASVGAAPPAGIRVRRVLHYTFVNPQNGANNFLFPSEGNLLVATMAANNGINPVNSVTDSNGQTYTARAVSGNSQVFDKQNATPGDTLVLDVNFNGVGQQDSLHLWDVVGAQTSSFLNTAGANTAAPGSGLSCPNLPTITPSAAPGLTIVQAGMGTASQGGMASGAPSGSVFDGVTYDTSSSLFDQDRMDNADPFGHVNYSTTATQNWNWVITAQSHGSTAFATACCYH